MQVALSKDGPLGLERLLCRSLLPAQGPEYLVSCSDLFDVVAELALGEFEARTVFVQL